MLPHIDNKSLVKNIHNKIKNVHSTELKQIFGESHVILAQRQPKNLIRTLTSAKFISTSDNAIDKPIGVVKCDDSRCKICRLYLQAVSNFKLSNGKVWEIRCHITCRSNNVIYFLKCKFCGYTTYIGKTEGDIVKGFKVRMNTHIYESKIGTSSCKFPRHVHQCMKQVNNPQEPYFEIYIMLQLKSPELLETYERAFHNRNYDIMNAS